MGLHLITLWSKRIFDRSTELLFFPDDLVSVFLLVQAIINAASTVSLAALASLNTVKGEHLLN